MDHYNATVHNGALVSTRRGLHVSKTKHQGTRFVNTFAAPASPSPASLSPKNSHLRPPESSDAQDQKFKFVEKRRSTSRRRPRGRSNTPKSRNTTPPKSSPRSGLDTISHGQQVESASRGSNDGSNDGTFTSAPDMDFSRAWDSSLYGEQLPNLPGGLVDEYLENLSDQRYSYGELANPPFSFEPTFAENAVDVERSAITNLMGQGSTSGTAYSSREGLSTTVLGRGPRSMTTAAASAGPIADEALSALENGRYDDWHRCMRALVPQAWGMGLDWGNAIEKIRRADVEGAALTGSEPYLDFPKSFNYASDVLPPQLRAKLAGTLQYTLHLCGMPEMVFEPVRSLVLLTHNVIRGQTSSPPGPYQLQPKALEEEHLRVEHQLLRLSGSIQSAMEMGSFANPAASSFGAAIAAGGYDYTKSFHEAGFQAPPTNQQQGGMSSSQKLLGFTLRTAALLYVQASSPDRITPPPYRMLLNLLKQQVRNISMKMHHGSHTQSFPFTYDGLPPVTALRPVIIWVCMVAYRIADIVETKAREVVDRESYQDFVGMAVGSSKDDVDKLSKNDLSLCRLLPVQHIGENGEDRMLLKQIISDYQKKQLLQPVDPFL